MEAYAKYKAEFNQFNFDITAGYSWQNWMSAYPSLRATRLTDNSYGVNNPSVAKKVEAFNSALENRLISFFGRANLAFKDKYLLTASLRRDGSTRFGPENRWGTFASAAAAWRLIDEEFMAGAQNVFSDLKLRVGFGVNGQQDGIGDFGYLATYSPSTLTAQYQIGNEFITTIRPNGYDRNLKWEETTSYNIGLDFGILDNRVTGSVDYYIKNTKDLLFERAVPAGSNLTNIILSNVGEIKNQGIELTVNAVAVDKGALRWDLALNAAFNKNEIIALDGDDDPSFKGYETGGISGGVGNNIQILKVGQPAYAFYVYKQRYVDGKPAVNTIDYNEDGSINLADMYEDVTGDGLVNDQDRRPFHQRAPKVLLGLTSNLTYKDFDLSFTIRSNLGGYVYNNVASNTANLSRANDNFAPRNMVTSVLETNFTQPQYFSDYYVEKADFLRMDNITLGYTTNKLVNGKAKVRVYATVQNPFIMTEYKGLDPEVPSGIDNNIYPRSRTFIFGLNLGF
jgi:iron complex outermembrane receptor protein